MGKWEPGKKKEALSYAFMSMDIPVQYKKGTPKFGFGF